MKFIPRKRYHPNYDRVIMEYITTDPNHYVNKMSDYDPTYSIVHYEELPGDHVAIYKPPTFTYIPIHDRGKDQYPVLLKASTGEHLFDCVSYINKNNECLVRLSKDADGKDNPFKEQSCYIGYYNLVTKELKYTYILNTFPILTRLRGGSTTIFTISHTMTHNTIVHDLKRDRSFNTISYNKNSYSIDYFVELNNFGDEGRMAFVSGCYTTYLDDSWVISQSKRVFFFYNLDTEEVQPVGPLRDEDNIRKMLTHYYAHNERIKSTKLINTLYNPMNKVRFFRCPNLDNHLIINFTASTNTTKPPFFFLLDLRDLQVSLPGMNMGYVPHSAIITQFNDEEGCFAYDGLNNLRLLEKEVAVAMRIEKDTFYIIDKDGVAWKKRYTPDVCSNERFPTWLDPQSTPIRAIGSVCSIS